MPEHKLDRMKETSISEQSHTTRSRFDVRISTEQHNKEIALQKILSRIKMRDIETTKDEMIMKCEDKIKDDDSIADEIAKSKIAKKKIEAGYQSIVNMCKSEKSEKIEKIAGMYLDGANCAEKYIIQRLVGRLEREQRSSTSIPESSLQHTPTNDNTKGSEIPQTPGNQDTPPVAGPSHQPDNIRERNTLHNMKNYDLSAIMSIAASRLNQKKSLSHKDTYESIRESCIKIKMFRNFYDSNQSLVSRYANTYGEVTEAQAINATSQLEVSLKKLKLAKESAMYIASSNIYGPLTE